MNLQRRSHKRNVIALSSPCEVFRCCCFSPLRSGPFFFLFFTNGFCPFSLFRKVSHLEKRASPRTRVTALSPAGCLLFCNVRYNRTSFCSAPPPPYLSTASRLMHRKLHLALITQFPSSKRYLEFLQPIISRLALRFKKRAKVNK